MDEKKYLTEPLSVDAQIENLKSINLIINDEAYAKDVLSRISYFRLIKAYGLGLKQKTVRIMKIQPLKKLLKSMSLTPD